MTVTRVSKTADESAVIPANQPGSYDLVYNVWSNDPADGPLVIAAASPYVLGSVYQTETERDLFSILQEIEPRRKRDSDRHWELHLRFRKPPAPEGGNNPERAQDPFLRPPDISWEKDFEQQAVRKAYFLGPQGWSQTKVPVMNSASGLYADALVRRVPIRVLKYTRNERVYPMGWDFLYQDTVNSTPFLGWPAGWVTCTSITGSWKAERVEAALVQYWRVAYEFRFKRGGWIDELNDCGAFYRESASPDKPQRKSVRTVDGVPMRGPFFLDGNGFLLTQADIDAGRFHYRTYCQHDFADFGPMRITIPY